MPIAENEMAGQEALAQYRYDKEKLKDELDTLREDYLMMEENLELFSAALKEKESVIKRSDQQVVSCFHIIKEKDHLIVTMERHMKQMMESNEKLNTEIRSLQAEKRNLEKQNEFLLDKEMEIRKKYSEIEKKNLELKHSLQSLNEEKSLHTAQTNLLEQRIKALENEKLALQDKIDIIMADKRSPLKGHINNSPPRCVDFTWFNKRNSNMLDSDLSLGEELLLVEIREKEESMKSLEEKLNVIEETISGMKSKIRDRLKEAVDVILSTSNANDDFQFIFSSLKPSFELLAAQLKYWSERLSGESNPLTDAPDSVEINETVINAQPVCNRSVEAISIATQTDRILLAKALEEFSPLQNALDHKYGDVDMDLYRSYRKLSILPEEEDDETFKRIPSLKNAINSKSITAKIPRSYKTYSADDILNFEKRNDYCPLSEKIISSCTNIILSGRNNISEGAILKTEFYFDSPKSSKKNCNDFSILCDNTLSGNSNCKSEQRSINNFNATHLCTSDSVESIRHPHSFDSYLDPQQIQTGLLPRQISDPTQNGAFDVPLTRRASYLKRPRSTCRPLRLLCEENAEKREERTSKVRFDLSNNGNSKPNDNTNGSKGPSPASNLKNNWKVERISRFTVERVDEDEFRKSIEESNKVANRKRPSLIHSVVYKKSVLHDMMVYDPENSLGSADGIMRLSITGSPDSPSYETATESSPVGSFDMASYESNYLIADIYPCKRRKQSDSSNYSTESQDSIDGNDILVKSIRLHTNSEYITMKELDRESSTSSHLSMDMDIPYIDAEELPVIKPSPEVLKRTFSEADDDDINPRDEEGRSPDLKTNPPSIESASGQSNNESSSSDPFITSFSEIIQTAEVQNTLSPPKSSGLSKSPTVLKNLANFELYNTVSESLNKVGSPPIRGLIVEEEEEGSDHNEESDIRLEDDHEEEEESTVLKLTSPDVSEMSDTVTYVTVKSDPSNVVLSSDGDSDTYVTIQSDKSTLERKFSDLSENSSSPYNTPPDTSSASFCTPPDTYSPILDRIVKHFGGSVETDSSRSRSSSPYRPLEPNSYNGRGDQRSLNSNIIKLRYDASPVVSPIISSPCSSPFKQNNYAVFSQEQITETESVTIYNIGDSNFPSEGQDSRERKELIMFDSPQLEFYETNDSIENLEAFLKTEEGMQELVKAPVVSELSWRASSLEDLQEEPIFFEGAECKGSDGDEGSYQEGFSKANSLESPCGAGDSKLYEKRGKRHPPLSRQNSTEEYNFLEPHDSCLNLSEEISSPSTTPDTSNKTVIFKNKPLTVSNTIDLEDDDFPISESEIQINFNESETEIVEIVVADSGKSRNNKRFDIYSCRSEPCIPSMSSSSDLPTIVRLPKQSSSMTDDESAGSSDLKSDGNILPMPPEIIVSNLSSESENDSDVAGALLIDFASNVSERSEINLSDLNSLSAQSDNAETNSDPSDNIPEFQITDPEMSLSVSPEISDNSSSSPHVNDFDMELTDIGPTLITETDCSHQTEDLETLYVDIPEQLTESNIGNLRVLIPDDVTQVGNNQNAEASLHYECDYLYASLWYM